MTSSLSSLSGTTTTTVVQVAPAPAPPAVCGAAMATPASAANAAGNCKPTEIALPGTFRAGSSIRRGACAKLVAFACDDGGTGSPGAVDGAAAAAACDVSLQWIGMP